MGHPVEDTNLEKAIYDWIVEQREFEIAVTRRNVIANALSRDLSFKRWRR